MYDPKVTCYPYTEYTDRHYLVVKKNDGTVFDKNYPFVDRSAKYRFIRFFFRIVTVAIAFPVCRIRMGLRIKGRKLLRKHRALLKQGAVSVSNHVHMWDFIAVMRALYPFAPRVVAWDKNVSGENGTMIRYAAGGIPVPVNDVHATGAFLRAMEGYLSDGGMIHVCAEGSMWEYYAPIRPFKVGAFTLAVKSRKPVLPLAFSYREPKGLNKLLHPKGLFTLTVGEPLMPDTGISAPEAAKDLTVRAHDAVCRLAGIDPEKNIYEPIFNRSRRIDYYTTEYGKKEKKIKKS